MPFFERINQHIIEECKKRLIKEFDMKHNKMITVGLAVALGSLSFGATSFAMAPAQDLTRGADNFYKSDDVILKKVSFNTIYKTKIVGNLFIPKTFKAGSKNPAIIVGHPMGAVKEQSSNLYAQKLAEQGFVTLAIDLPFFGESEGKARSVVAPDMFTEAFNASVDFLGTQSLVDKTRIGVLGICGSGSFAISAAKIDPRLKAIATVSMYDMGGVSRNGLKNSLSLEKRKEMIAAAANQRDIDFPKKEAKTLDYLPNEINKDSDPITREFHDFYRTPRGAHVPKGGKLEQTQNRTQASEVKFINFYPFNDMDMISPRPLLFIAGDNAHSKEFSDEAYKKASEPKELVIVPNAGHVDLYDKVEVIPFGKLASFFKTNLK